MKRRTFALALLVVGMVVAGTVVATPPALAEQASARAARVAAASIAVGDEHSCVLTVTGSVRCWGEGDDGRLGYGDTLDRGDNETPAVAGDVDLGGVAVAIAAGGAHTCALLTTGRVRCWGEAGQGQLGYGNTTSIGDDETPAEAGDVPVGGKVKAIAAGAEHTCAVLRSGTVRCWGSGLDGRLGYADTVQVGSGSTPAEVGDVPLGGRASAITSGAQHTCAVLMSREIRCWGYGFAGRLGYGNSDSIGDDETPASAGSVKVGGPVVAASAGSLHTCAVLTRGRVRCWGRGLHGRLGYGNGLDVGDNEAPRAAGDVDLDRSAVAITAGGEHSCAATNNRYLLCWGRSIYGQLGYGNEDSVGGTNTPAQVGLVPILDPIIAVDAGTHHTCALVPGGFVRCWGNGSQGRLGNADTVDIGDNEDAYEAGRIELGATARINAATGMKLRVAPRRDRRPPFTFLSRGRLTGAFVVDPASCGGEVRITVKRSSGTKVAGRVVPVTQHCRFRGQVSVPDRKVSPTPRRLLMTVRFLGSVDLDPVARTRTVRVQR